MPLATVFGGSGFIGRYVVSRLANEGWRVNVATPDPATALFTKILGNPGQITLLSADIRNPASLVPAVRHADAVVNVVGILYQRGRRTFSALHAEGAKAIAKAAKEAGAKNLVHVSAIGADPNSPSLYAQSKARGENMVRDVFPEATLLRPSIVFGPEDDFFNKFARMAQLSPFLPLIGGGRTRFQPIYVGDVADAILAALRSKQSQGKTYELGGPAIYSFEELMRLLLKEIKRKRALIPLPYPLAQLAAALLGWLPHPPLTLDQIRLLKKDNVVDPAKLGIAALGVKPHPLELILPNYLGRYRPRGFYDRNYAL